MTMTENRKSETNTSNTSKEVKDKRVCDVQHDMYRLNAGLAYMHVEPMIW